MIKIPEKALVVSFKVFENRGNETFHMSVDKLNRNWCQCEDFCLEGHGASSSSWLLKAFHRVLHNIPLCGEKQFISVSTVSIL